MKLTERKKDRKIKRKQEKEGLYIVYKNIDGY